MKQLVKDFVVIGPNLNLLVNLEPLGDQGKHYVESVEQAENGLLVVHAWNRGESPRYDFCLLDMQAPIFIVRDLEI